VFETYPFFVNCSDMWATIKRTNDVNCAHNVIFIELHVPTIKTVLLKLNTWLSSTNFQTFRDSFQTAQQKTLEEEEKNILWN